MYEVDIPIQPGTGAIEIDLNPRVLRDNAFTPSYSCEHRKAMRARASHIHAKTQASGEPDSFLSHNPDLIKRFGLFDTATLPQIEEILSKSIGIDDKLLLATLGGVAALANHEEIHEGGFYRNDVEWLEHREWDGFRFRTEIGSLLSDWRGDVRIAAADALVEIQIASEIKTLFYNATKAEVTARETFLAIYDAFHDEPFHEVKHQLFLALHKLFKNSDYLNCMSSPYYQSVAPRVTNLVFDINLDFDFRSQVAVDLGRADFFNSFRFALENKLFFSKSCSKLEEDFGRALNFGRDIFYYFCPGKSKLEAQMPKLNAIRMIPYFVDGLPKGVNSDICRGELMSTLQLITEHDRFSSILITEAKKILGELNTLLEV